MKFGQDSYHVKRQFKVKDKEYHFYSLQALSQEIGDLTRLPFSLKILLENVVRFENGQQFSVKDIAAFKEWLTSGHSSHEIAFQPARVLMQDFTGVPAVVDLATMRQALQQKNLDPALINPLTAVDLVIDHSVMVDFYGSSRSFEDNVRKEYERNLERYQFLKWGQRSLKNFRVVPPDTGICHQVNLEYLAQVVWQEKRDDGVYAYPDTVVGTDSHTTMINALGVLGWGVGGIEAEAAMLGQPSSMLIPDVIGVKLKGDLQEGRTATDLVLTITHMLRKEGVVGKFVEFYGAGLNHLSLADRATISNMSPEFGSTCAIFPIDDVTLDYLRFSGRPAETVALVETYAKEQGLWRTETAETFYTKTLELDLVSVEPTLAGPKRPQDKLTLASVKTETLSHLKADGYGRGQTSLPQEGDVVIAAITSCTNTSNPAVLIGAGLLARKARQLGLQTKDWVKTSLAPGSQVVTDYLEKSGLQEDLNALGFNLVGYGCTTCIGNSGSLREDVAKHIEENKVSVAAVLSGNRNFEGRVHPQVKLNYLASPPLVVAYALAGTMCIDLAKEPLGKTDEGKDIYLKDVWPTNQEIRQIMKECIDPSMFHKRYSNVFEGDKYWQSTKAESSVTYNWDENSTYVKIPPYFSQATQRPLEELHKARILALFGDSITTDHISPAGTIRPQSPAGLYLQSKGVEVKDFNSYGARRGNHEVMMRGTFANARLVNEMIPHKPGGYTILHPQEKALSIYEAAMAYKQNNIDTLIVAGKEYGSGSSRDWAAKGTYLLGIKAVLAESFERIHRANLVGMGVLPLEFTHGATRKTLSLDGSEEISLRGYKDGIAPKMLLTLDILRKSGQKDSFQVVCRIDTLEEVAYYNHGGILPYVLKNVETTARDMM